LKKEKLDAEDGRCLPLPREDVGCGGRRRLVFGVEEEGGVGGMEREKMLGHAFRG